MLQCGAKKVNPVEPFVTSLPVAAILPELLTVLKTAPQVLLSAPTGAGKSTWLPLQLLQQGPVAGKILLLEPRRLAARNVAQRLAEALNEKLGETVGYRMRAQSCVGPRTRLEVVTEGVLTRMIQRDPELRGVGLATLENWLLPHMTGVQSLRSLKSLNVTQALRGLLDYAMLQRLDSELPGHYTVPTGSRITIRYHEDNPPALAVRMQEMFGEAKTPTIAQGRVPLVLELLSPAQRPLQITRDLSAFWQGAYREVQKEMKGRYPKHVWPDDPANTAPTRRTKKYS
ncbi:hypothetical protein GMM39_03940 [Salmonella enterica subsp. enterica]|nr:hypothetical protein [Salmonella enterica subsp. enterica]